MSTITYDLDWLKSAEIKDLHAAMRDPESLASVNALLRTPEGKEIASEMINSKGDYVPISKRPPDEEAQIAADTARAEAQAVADAEAAAQTAAEAAAVPVVTPPSPPVEEKKKIVMDYQATLEDGTPVGRPTHIEGYSHEEIEEKLKTAHINAVRYAERMKKSKVQTTQSQIERQQTQQTAETSKAEADAALAEASKDVTKLPDAVRKVSKADRDKQIADETARQHGIAVANAWLADHKDDFFLCDANSQMIGSWLKTAGPNGTPLDWTYDNLDLAFEANKNRLAKPQTVAPVEEVSAPPANNPPVAAPVTPPAAAPIAPAAPATAAPVPVVETPVSQPVSTTPSSTPVAATNTPAARRPGVNTSLQPGSFSAQRPTAAAEPVESTRSQLLKEIKNMDPAKYRLKLKDEKYVQRLIAAGIPVIGHSA